jgi:hypothetical protein
MDSEKFVHIPRCICNLRGPYDAVEDATFRALLETLGSMPIGAALTFNGIRYVSLEDGICVNMDEEHADLERRVENPIEVPHSSATVGHEAHTAKSHDGYSND